MADDEVKGGMEIEGEGEERIEVRPAYGDRPRMREAERRVLYRRGESEEERELFSGFRNVAKDLSNRFKDLRGDVSEVRRQLRGIGSDYKDMKENVREMNRWFKDVSDVLLKVTRNFYQLRESVKLLNSQFRYIANVVLKGVQEKGLNVGAVGLGESLQKLSGQLKDQLELYKYMNKEIVDLFELRQREALWEKDFQRGLERVRRSQLMEERERRWLEGSGLEEKLIILMRRGYEDLKETAKGLVKAIAGPISIVGGMINFRDLGSFVKEKFGILFGRRRVEEEIEEAKAEREFRVLTRKGHVDLKENIKGLIKAAVGPIAVIGEMIDFEAVRSFVKEKFSVLFGRKRVGEGAVSARAEAGRGVLGLRRGQELEVIQERGAEVLAKQLVIKVEEGVKFEGLGGRAGGGEGGILEALGLVHVFRWLRGGLDKVKGVLPLLGRFGLALSVLTGGYFSYRDFMKGYKEEGISGGLGGFLFGTGKGRLGRGLEGLTKGAGIGAVIGGIAGSIIPGAGTVTGAMVGAGIGGAVMGLLHVFKEEFNKIGEKVAEGISDLGSKLVGVIGELVNKIKGIWEGVKRGIEIGKEGIKKKAKEVMESGKEYIEKIGKSFGWLSSLFEVGEVYAAEPEKALRIVGLGQAIGPWQMEERTFRVWAEKYGYGRRFRDKFWLSEEWWREYNKLIEEIGPHKLVQQMREFLVEQNLKPLVKQSAIAERLWGRSSRALQEYLFATAVQYGPEYAKSLIEGAFKGVGIGDLEGMSEREIIRRLAEYKRDTVDRYFRAAISRDRRIKGGLIKRFTEEEGAAYRLLEQEIREPVAREHPRNLMELMKSDVDLRGVVRGGIVPEERREGREEKKEGVVIGGISGGGIEGIPNFIDDLGVLLLQLGLV